MGHNMRITDLLDKNSISLNAAPADKRKHWIWQWN